MARKKKQAAEPEDVDLFVGSEDFDDSDPKDVFGLPSDEDDGAAAAPAEEATDEPEDKAADEEVVADEESSPEDVLKSDEELEADAEKKAEPEPEPEDKKVEEKPPAKAVVLGTMPDGTKITTENKAEFFGPAVTDQQARVWITQLNQVSHANKTVEQVKAEMAAIKAQLDRPQQQVAMQEQANKVIADFAGAMPTIRDTYKPIVKRFLQHVDKSSDLHDFAAMNEDTMALIAYIADSQLGFMQEKQQASQAAGVSQFRQSLEQAYDYISDSDPVNSPLKDHDTRQAFEQYYTSLAPGETVYQILTSEQGYKWLSDRWQDFLYRTAMSAAGQAPPAGQDAPRTANDVARRRAIDAGGTSRGSAAKSGKYSREVLDILGS